MRTFKGICYTVLCGDYDNLKNPKVVTPGWKYVCFTDQDNVKSDIWEIRELPTKYEESLSQIKKQRVVKIAPHQYIPDYNEYEVSVYVDASVLIKTDLNTFINSLIEENNDFEICITKHPIRNCIYKEEKTVVAVKKDVKEITEPQIEKYRKEGFPENYGLNETNVIIRFKSEKVNQIMDDWMAELVEHSHRDQLSFNYVLWKHNYKILDMSVKKRNENFLTMRHKAQKLMSKTLKVKK